MAIIIIVLVLKVFKRKNTEKHVEYIQKDNLFSPAERSFLGVLESAISTDTRVFGKVRVADVLSPAETNNKSSWQIAFNKIAAKHFDFVLCDKSSLNVKAVIELDDKSHNFRKVRIRDAFINDICKNAKLPIIRFPAKQAYVVDDVKQHIFSALGEHSNEVEDKACNADDISGSQKIPKLIEEVQVGQELISTHQIAKNLNMSTNDFIDALLKNGYLDKQDSKLVLTKLGKSVGGLHVQQSRFGPYFKWPARFYPYSPKNRKDNEVS